MTATLQASPMPGNAGFPVLYWRDEGLEGVEA
jgi:hypothetical protein